MSNPKQKANGDKVGYGNPPKATQFKKGQSGNPKGRPKKANRSNQTILMDILEQQISTGLSGQKKKMQIREAIIRARVQKALKGDLRAQELIFAEMPDEVVDEAAKRNKGELVNSLLEMMRQDKMEIIEDLKQRMIDADIPEGKIEEVLGNPAAETEEGV